MKTLIKNASLVSNNKLFEADVVINGDKIEQISEKISTNESNYSVIEASGMVLIPGVIDDQVHFREPGLTHKGEIKTESKAAVAGGVTSLMEMPNTNPQTTTQDLLEQKFERGGQKSYTNFSFYLGATNSNLKEIIKTNPKNVCGIKVFMGSSTGNMLVDKQKSLEGIFAEAPCLIATHCEDEATIKANLEKFKLEFGNNILPKHHPLIRSEEACYASSAKAVELATKYGSKLHVLHLSTAKELKHFTQGNILEKKVTAEVCVHHLWFNDADYERLGNKIRWNPAIKTKADQEGLFNALLNDRLDVVATDHAPHLLSEKAGTYLESASGGPLIQDSLLAMLDFYHSGKISLQKIVQKMCHAPADLFSIDRRGYLKEGYFADLVLIDLKKETSVNKDNILYKCKWSPFEGHTFKSKIVKTFVNGNLIYDNGNFVSDKKGMALRFNR